MQYLFIKRKLLRYKSFLISKMKKYDSNIPIHLQFIILNDKQYYRLKFKYNKSLTNQDQYGQVQQYYSQSVYSVHDGLQVQECNQLEEKNAALDNENQKIYKKKIGSGELIIIIIIIFY